MKNNKLRTIPSVAKRIKRNKYSTPTRLPAFSRFSLSDPASLVDSAEARVHSELNQTVEVASGWSDWSNPALDARVSRVNPVHFLRIPFEGY